VRQLPMALLPRNGNAFDAVRVVFGSGLPVVMEQERTLGRVAELSAVPAATGMAPFGVGSPACGEDR
jgi:hypothetical protein